MSDLLSIGASGVRAYQGALGAVSENIANSGVAGYSRRTADLREVTAAGGMAAGRALSGDGVRMAGVVRQADLFKAQAARGAGADLARTESGAAWMDRIDGALGGSGLDARVTGFFGAAQTLAADPTSGAARSAMLEAGAAAAAAFAATGRALAQVRVDLDGAAADAVDRLDAGAAALAKVNDRIGRAPAGSAAAASLADERDRLLDGMGALAAVGVELDGAGRATVRLGGAGGPVFVAGGEAGHVTYALGDGGAASFAVHRAGAAQIFAPNGGALAGVEDGARRTADAREALDELAGGFAGAVNGVQAGGRDLDGQAGRPIFAVGAGPAELTLAMSDPRGIAAASAGGGARDASNLQALQAARASAGTEAGLSALTAANAAALAQRKVVAEAQAAIRDGAVGARDAVAGVDLDTEAVDLMRFQQAYQASSRVIQVARETFQTILDSGR